MAELEIAEFVRRCNQCAICSGTCPKARVSPGFLPRRMVYDVVTGNEERVITSGDGWKCLTCMQCQVKCPMNVDFVEMVRGIRKKMLEKGMYTEIAHSNTFGPSLFEILSSEKVTPRRKNFLAQDVKLNDNSDVLYFMGCVTYLDIVFKDDVGFEGMGIADNTLRLLNKVGIEPAVLDGEKCCGHDQYWRGEHRLFKEFARQNEKMLKKYRTIVVSCPECYRTLAVEYKNLGIALNVKHISEVLKDNIDKLGAGEKKVATFHDACRLGRYMDVYGAPRDILAKAGYELKEMEHSKSEALCCGISQFLNCNDENKRIRQKKMREAVETGAEILVTPCAKCQIHLKCLQNDKSEKMAGTEYKIKIVDFSTAIAQGVT